MASAITKKKERAKLMNRMRKDTHFTEQFECENLVKKWEEICDNGVLSRTQFRDFCFKTFFLTDDVMLDRVFKAFDLDNDGKISTEEWLRGLSVYLRGTPKEQAKFCFDVYDMNNDGYISREEMFHLLKNAFIASKNVADEDPDEGIRDLVDLALKRLKTDPQDPRITPKDFEEAVEKEPLVLEILGPCLPAPKCCNEFEETVCAAGAHHSSYGSSSSSSSSSHRMQQAPSSSRKTHNPSSKHGHK